MSQYVIVSNKVDMEDAYLVELPDGFDIERDSEFGPLEYAEACGEYLGVYAESFGPVGVSRLYSSRAEALGSQLGEVNVPSAEGGEDSTRQTNEGRLAPLRRAELEGRIANYVLELTPGDVRSIITPDEAAQAAYDILQLVLAAFTAR